MFRMESISKNTVYACLLGFIGTSILVLSQTYSSMIFLTHYTTSEIPYLYLASGLIAAAAMQLLKNYMHRSISRFARTTHYFFLAVLIPFIWLLEIKSAWLPFIISTFLLIIVSFTHTTYILVEMRAFTLREFKALGKWLSASSTFGAIVWGPLIPLILKFWPAHVMLYVIIALLIFALLIIGLADTAAPAHFVKKQLPPPKVNLFKNPLFLTLFITGILAQIIQTFADFAPKSLMTSYSQHQIGEILGPLYSITNVIAIFSQLFLSAAIVKRFGVFGILFTLPITVIPAAIAFVVYPHLWVALAFAGIAISSRFGFYAIGQQMVMNVLPDTLINDARYQMGSIGRNLGAGFAALLLILLNYLGGIRLTAVGTIAACVLLLYYFIISQRNYKQALTKSINLHRFNVDYLGSVEADAYIINDNAETALRSSSPDVQLFGLELLRKSHLKSVPQILYDILSTGSDTVKINTLKVIKSIHDHGAWEVLYGHLQKENNPIIIWHLTRIILRSNHQILLPMASKFIESNDPYLKCSAICIFLKGGNVDQIILALEQFKAMANDENPNSRMVACEVLDKSSRFGDLSDYVIKLLNDEKEVVAANAIRVAKRYHNDQVVNAILNNLRFNNLYHTISRTLIFFGPEIISKLMPKIKEEIQAHLILATINILAGMPGKRAEKELINLMVASEIHIQNPVAKSIAYRAMNFSFSVEHRKIIAEKIFGLVALIQKMIWLEENPPDRAFKLEIISRTSMARERYLYLIVALCENKVILQLIPTLMHGDKKSSTYSKALELLDINITDRSLAATIEFALENRKMPGAQNDIDIGSLADPWLDILLDFKNAKHPEEIMDIINKILVLREVDLFSSLSAEALESIAETLNVVDIVAGQTIFTEGDIADGLYIIAKGKVTITKKNSVLKEYKENGFFGELALMDNEPRTGTAIADTDCVLYLLEKSDFNRLSDDVPEILKVIIQTIMKYLRPYLADA
jgi:CRP/FNR family cyclic AMP-dependent transcriptional regulator